MCAWYVLFYRPNISRWMWIVNCDACVCVCVECERATSSQWRWLDEARSARCTSCGTSCRAACSPWRCSTSVKCSNAPRAPSTGRNAKSWPLLTALGLHSPPLSCPAQLTYYCRYSLPKLMLIHTHVGKLIWIVENRSYMYICNFENVYNFKVDNFDLDCGGKACWLCETLSKGLSETFYSPQRAAPSLRSL